MNKFILDTFTKYNLIELCGQPTRITACSWDSITLDRNQHNSSTVNKDTKWYFDNINDITIDDICEHYGTDKYYRSDDIRKESVVVQITIVPASIYTAKGMYNGYIIFSNDYITNPYVLANGEYKYMLYDNPTEPAYDYLVSEYDKKLIEFTSLIDYIKYNTTNESKVFEDIHNEIEQKYKEIIEQEYKQRITDLKQSIEIKRACAEKCSQYAKRNKYLATALNIDLTKYKQLFDYD